MHESRQSDMAYRCRVASSDHAQLTREGISTFLRCPFADDHLTLAYRNRRPEVEGGFWAGVK